MIWRHWPTIRPYIPSVSVSLYLLLCRVVARRAQALDVVGIPEQSPITTVRRYVINDSGCCQLASRAAHDT